MLSHLKLHKYMVVPGKRIIYNEEVGTYQGNCVCPLENLKLNN